MSNTFTISAFFNSIITDLLTVYKSICDYISNRVVLSDRVVSAVPMATQEAPPIMVLMRESLSLFFIAARHVDTSWALGFPTEREGESVGGKEGGNILCRPLQSS